MQGHGVPISGNEKLDVGEVGLSGKNQ